MIDRAQLKLSDYFVQKSAKPKKISTLSVSVGQMPKEVIPLSIFAFLFGMASINGLYPFTLSFAAANFIYRNNFIIPTVFSYLGTLVAIKGIISIRYLGAIGIFFIIYTLLNRTNRQNQLLLLGLAVFFSNVLSGLIFLRTYGISPFDIFLLLAESVMASIMTFIIPGGMPWLFKEPIQPTERNICMAVLAGVLLSIARNFVWLGVNVRDVFGVFAVLLLALIDGSGAGAAAGIIIGITGFSFSLSPWSTAIMAFSGLISGSFNKLGKIGVITGFSLGYLLYNFYVNSMGEAIISLPVLAVAFILVLLLPQNIINRTRLYLSSSYNGTNLESYQLEERARDRLYELASLLSDLGGAFKDTLIKKEERILSAEYLDLVCRKAQLEVCSDCGMRRICWEKEPKRTMASFYTLIKHQEGLSDKNTIPFLFKSRCGQTETIKKIVKE
ncbi:MAG: stage II sporulation protein E, partial [Thermoanaerobacteraceae bacterium]|nr:stage II sporulation protein E [Thermoanaerobacteraceae bacterium]